MSAVAVPARQNAQVADRLVALQHEAEALARQERTLLTELRQLEVERDLRTEELRRAEQELVEVTRQRDDTAARIAALEGRVAVEAPGLSERLVQIYKLGRPGYVRMLFDVDSVRAAGRAYRTVSALVQADRRRVAQFNQALTDLRASERALGDRTARAQALEADAQRARQGAASAVARHNALIAQIDTRRDLNARLLGELQAAQHKLAALAPAAAPGGSPAPPAAGLPARRGTIDWPAAGTLASRFGTERDARSGAATSRAGVEIGAVAGSVASAVEEGVVTYAEPFTGFGNLVIIDHGRQAYSLYGYLDSVSVAKGMRVSRGQPIGTVGHSPAGKSGLYFELRIDGKPVDPVQWLKKR